MKKWNWSKIMQAILLLIGAIGGGTYMVNESGIISSAPEQEAAQEIYDAAPVAPIKYVVDVQVVWKNTPQGLPGTHYLLAMHRVEMPTVPNIGNTFNEVKRLFVAGKIKAPVDDFVPVYGYTAELIARTGIPLAEPPAKTTPDNPSTK